MCGDRVHRERQRGITNEMKLDGFHEIVSNVTLMNNCGVKKGDDFLLTSLIISKTFKNSSTLNLSVQITLAQSVSV